MKTKILGAALVAGWLASSPMLAQQSAADRWVGTWATADVARAQNPPATAPGGPPAPTTFVHFTNQTLRQIVHASTGGSKARVVLSNFYGTAPLTIGAAHLALRDKEAAIQPASDRALMFSGRPTITIPLNAIVYSDPVDLTVPQMADLVIDVYLPGTTNTPSPLTIHNGAFQTNYISETGNHVGKTLRLRDDGSVPPDNPFVDRPGAKPEIFTYGHRNGYGLAFHPETGALWQAEIGPLGGDELNILLPGRNYGWPLVSSGRNYTGTLVSDEPWSRPGMEMPRMIWVPSISPSSITFYTGDRFPRWKGSLFVGALNGKQLQRVSFNQPSQAERREPLLTQLDVRIRDVRQGADGLLYVATEKRSAGDDADGTILRIEPAD